MKIIKVFIWLIVISTILITVTGCSKSDGTETNDIHDIQDTQETLSTSDCETITIWFMTNQGERLEGVKEMLEALNERTAAEINTKVEFIWLEAPEYGSQLLSSLKSGNDAPDAFMIDDYSNIKYELQEKGFLEDITDNIPTYLGRYFSALTETWGNELDDICKFNGRIYTVPCNKADSGRYCVIAREDLVDRYMADGMKDINDYCEFLKAVKDNENDNISPGLFYGNDLADAYITANGYINITPDPYVSYVYMKSDDEANEAAPLLMHQTDAYQAAYDMYKDLLACGALFKGRNTKIPVQEGSLASILCRMSEVERIYPDFTSAYQYRMYPLNMESVSLKPGHNGFALGINPGSKNADRVLLFISWIQSSQENYDLVMYGIKDRHYKLIGNRLDLADIEGSGGHMVTGWRGSAVFANNLYRRPFFFEPENYAEFMADYALKNTITYSEFLKSKGYDISRLETLEQEEKYDRRLAFQSVTLHLSHIYGLFYDYFSLIEQGRTDYTLEQAIKELSGVYQWNLEEDMDIVLYYYKMELQMLK